LVHQVKGLDRLLGAKRLEEMFGEDKLRCDLDVVEMGVPSIVDLKERLGVMYKGVFVNNSRASCLHDNS
jgi:hypothetical protein